MIKVLDKTFALFETLRATGPAQLRDLSSATGITKTTLFTILKTLHDLGYLEQGPDGRYGISAKFQSLSTPLSPFERFSKMAGAVVSALAEKVGENTTAIVLEQRKRKIAARHEGGRLVSIDAGALEDDFYTFASGRILLAHMSEVDRHAIWETQGVPGPKWPEVKTREQLEKQLRAVRASEVVQVEHDDTIGLAAPIVIPGCSIIGALGVFLPEARFHGAARRRLPEALVESAARLRRALEGDEIPSAPIVQKIR